MFVGAWGRSFFDDILLAHPVPNCLKAATSATVGALNDAKFLVGRKSCLEPSAGVMWMGKLVSAASGPVSIVSVDFVIFSLFFALAVLAAKQFPLTFLRSFGGCCVGQAFICVCISLSCSLVTLL